MTEPPLADPALADAPADATVSTPDVLAKSFRSLERYRVTLRHADGRTSAITRDVLHVGHVIGVLTIDPARNVIVLIRQFRVAAHLALGLGELVEIVAGHVEHGESAEQAARRECCEEIGVEPQMLHPILRFHAGSGRQQRTYHFVCWNRRFQAPYPNVRVPRRRPKRLNPFALISRQRSPHSTRAECTTAI